MMNIIPSQKWLSTEYLRTNTVALLFWSDWHTRALGCLFSEEYGKAMLSRLLMRSREVGNAQSVQQTTDIFFPPPPTLPGEKKFCAVSGSDFVVFISLLTLSWAKFRPGPSIFFRKHTIFELPHLCPVYTLCSKSGYCDHVQRTMSYYGPYPGPIWQLGVESRVTLATVGFCCQGSLLDLRPLPRGT